MVPQIDQAQLSSSQYKRFLSCWHWKLGVQAQAADIEVAPNQHNIAIRAQQSHIVLDNVTPPLARELLRRVSMGDE